MSDAQPGPLSRLLSGLGLDDKLPPIPTVKPIDVMPVKVCIDLRGRNLDLRYEYQGKRIGWACWDDNSYDGAPDSDSNHIGYGPEKEDALADLLEKLGPSQSEIETESAIDDALHTEAFGDERP